VLKDEMSEAVRDGGREEHLFRAACQLVEEAQVII